MPIFTVFGTLPAFLALFLILNRTVFQLKRYLLATVAFTLGIYDFAENYIPVKKSIIAEKVTDKPINQLTTLL